MGQAPLNLLGVACFLLGSCSGYSSHSLHYFITSVSVPGQQTPQFFSVGYVDGQQFISYDAKARRCLPKVDWITKVEKEAPEYWEEESQSFWNEEQRFRVNMVTAAKYYNQSGGVHTWQLMYGCELRRDGSKGGHYQFAYDGSDYIGLDKETLTWTAIDMPAQITKRKWEAEPAFAQRDKAYLEETCIKWLERYLDYGKETLLRTEAPDVNVTRKADYDGMETLICHVRGFYPKDIDISWTKDGEDRQQDTFHGLVSPNSDGTYYTWRSIKVDPEERERYKCHVEHDGLPDPLNMAWEEPAYNGRTIIGSVVGVLLLIVLMTGFAVYFKVRQDGYRAAIVSDQGSNNSETA